MAIKHKAGLGLDLDSRRILLMRQQEEGKLDQLRYVGPTVWNGVMVPIYVDTKELTISTEPTDWAVHLGNLKATMLNGKRSSVIRTVEELSAERILFETELKGKYLVDSAPEAARRLITALATGRADQVRLLHPLFW